MDAPALLDFKCHGKTDPVDRGGHFRFPCFLRFDHAADGEFLTFSADLCDRYGNTRNLPLTVRVRVEKVRTLDHLDENGTPVYALVPVPAVTVTPADWYGGG